MDLERFNNEVQDEAFDLSGKDFTDDEEKAQELDHFFSQVYELCEEVKPYVEGR